MQPLSYQQFQQLAMHGNVIPVAESIFADLLTPVSAFLKLCGHDEDGFLLESVEGGEKLGRYSFLGRMPREYVDFDGRRVTVHSGGASREIESDIFTFLHEKFKRYRFVRRRTCPAFPGGWWVFLVTTASVCWKGCRKRTRR